MRVKLTGMYWPAYMAGREFHTTSEHPGANGWHKVWDHKGHEWNVNTRTATGDYGATILVDSEESLALIRTTIEGGLNAGEDSTDILVEILKILER